MSEEIQNAVIKSTFLGVEDHGLLTGSITVEGPGWGQGTGHGIFDAPLLDSAAGRPGRRDFGITGEYVKRMCAAVGVDNWEQLKGKHVRVRRVEPYSDITAVGHFLEDKWFSVTDLFDEAKTWSMDDFKDPS